jgi:A/G-specific adenine glycosylase
MPKRTFSSQLLSWYRKHKRDLPWRRTRDPYKIWISEIMLQQTTVNAVIPYYEKWIKRYPTMLTLSRARIQTVLKSWEGLGYYSRARNIHAAAKIMVKEHGAKIPRDPAALIRLPGFGPYTVGAVLSIAYGVRIPIIDANIRRIVMRLLALPGQPGTAHDPVIKKWIIQNLPSRNMPDFNQAFMELGALVCAKQPLCYRCPVKPFCKAYARGTQEIIPEPRKKVYEDLDVVIGILTKGDKYYIQKRAGQGLLAGLWEFPGGKKESGESDRAALVREMQEECGIRVSQSRFLMAARHFYTNKRVKLHVYWCQTDEDPAADEARRWVSLRQIRKYPMPSGSVKIVDRLAALDKEPAPGK